ncbi:MAG: CoA-binding protein [Bacteroidetes bacterium]|nr:MAG: CoA-binding protein [Bacteroidota bacterium]
MTTLKQINEFIGSQPIALVGVSRNPKKFGYAAFKELKEKGMRIIPVNPEAIEIMGEKSYPNIKMLPPEVKGIIVLTKKDQTASVVREAKEKGIKQIWIQQMADSKEALQELKGSDINFITGECILMHFKPHSLHKFHGALKKFFGRYPK